MRLDQALEDFLLAARADGLAGSTLAWYGSVLGAFTRAHPGRRADSITARDCREYVAGLRDQGARYIGAPQKPEQAGGLSPASIAGHVRALHRFWAWSAAEYSISNPMGGIRKPRQPQPIPRGVDARDFVRLFEAAGDGPQGARNRALLAMLADTGCRLGGLASLERRGIDLERRRVLVTEKGGKPRRVTMSSYAAGLLGRWLTIQGDRPGPVFGLTESGIYQVITRLKKRAGITGRVNPHAFRHNFARVYLQNGGNLVTLAGLLGHESITTTAAFYAVFSPDEVSEMHERYSPLLAMLETG